ncbi:MAG: hypothetical protein HXY40_09470 [Chloroflexi bacterium]|nr:hypothetical protein [Chloroflexota bacterium]
MQYKKVQRALVEQLKRKGDLSDPRIEAAFLAVPRHVFLPGVSLEQAYADEAVPIKRSLDGIVISSSSQPSMMGLMLHQMRLQPGANVLEIGTGSGYNAAIMQHIVGDSGHVTTVELDRDLAQQALDHLAQVRAGHVTVVHADGAMGYQPRAAYDAIIATAGIWDIPAAWPKQLKDNGVIVAPIWLDGMQISAAFRRQPDGSLLSADNVPCGFVPLRGLGAGPRVSARITSSDLTLAAEEVDRIDTAALHVLLSADQELCFLGLAMSPSDYWQGFLPYLLLHQPLGYIFATYNLNSKAYGMEVSSGFALVTQGSAVFVPFNGQGNTHCFAGSDSFMALSDAAQTWVKAHRPGIDRLRLRLLPKSQEPPLLSGGKMYARRDHYLQVWMEGEAARDGA